MIADVKSWKTALLRCGATIKDGIENLEQTGFQISLLVDDDERLIGTLTDGDVRRAILSGHTTESILDDFVTKKPLVATPEIGRDAILSLMYANKIHQLPVVSKEGRVVGLHLLDSIVEPAEVENIFIIMAGGRGARLHPFTDNCPKPMLNVNGKPMLEHIINRAKDEGFSNFKISVHYLGDVIKKYFGDGAKLGVNIEYIDETFPLGTAGCLSLIEDRPIKPIVITNGDVITDIRYKDILEFHYRHEAVATMAVRQYEIQNQFGVVKINGLKIESFEEKPVYRSYINAGIYTLDPCVLNELNIEERCDMPTLFERLKLKGMKTIVFPMHEPWLDVGRPDDLRLANDECQPEN